MPRDMPPQHTALWRRIRPAALALCLLAGVFLGTGLFTFHAAEGVSYFSDNPRACVNCHIMRDPYDSWHKSSHQAVASCNDCHVSAHPVGQWISKADNGFRHAWAFTLDNFHEPIPMHPRGEAVLQQNCLRCHADVVSQTHHPAAADTHSTDCTRCHRAVGHAMHR